MDRSDHEACFEVPAGTHALVYVVVKNTGAWRGCKGKLRPSPSSPQLTCMGGSLLLRGSYDHFRMLDPKPPKDERTFLEETLQWFNGEFQPLLLRGEVRSFLRSPSRAADII